MRIFGKSIMFWLVVAVVLFVGYHWWMGRQNGTSTGTAARRSTHNVAHSAADATSG